jgi:rod shape-determining protein MreC
VTLLLAMLISMTLLTLNFRGGSTFSFVSVKADVRDVVAPLRGGLNSIFRPVSNVVSGAFDYGSLRTKNARLQNELNALQGSALRYRSEARMVEQVLALQHIPFEGSIPSIDAQVINFTPTNQQLSFEIDRGTSSGLKLGNPVVGAKGLAGKVVAVSATTATVLMLDDPSFAVGVRLDTTGTPALAQGQGVNEPIRVSLVTPGTPFAHNQVLDTSGLQGEVFPPGIPVGRVVHASNPPGALQESVSLEPVVDYANLQFVKVLLWVAPG